MVRTYPLAKKSYVICLGVFTLTTVCFIFQSTNTGDNVNYEYVLVNKEDQAKDDQVEEWLTSRRNLSGLSKLGKILYLSEEEPILTTNRKFKILIWRYGSTLENRHMKSYSNKRVDPFDVCSVKNCDITYDEADIKTADIVIFHMQRIKGVTDLPQDKRNASQIWAFLTDESPYHMFLTNGVKLSDFNGMFNWSMTYRKDSDIPVPYGRTVLKKQSEPVEITFKKRRDVLIAIMGSNCGGRNNRWEYVKELQKHITVDVYGGCGPFKTCPGHFRADCPDIDNYIFYLAFENSNCDDYITEKLWWNAYHKHSIPIVMGASLDNYQTLLPPGSFINIEEYASPAVLAQYIYHLNSTGEYRRYYEWQRHFQVLNEHAYFKSRSYHYCRVCQALNYNDKSAKVYEKLENFWNVGTDCHPAWNEWK